MKKQIKLLLTLSILLALIAISITVYALLQDSTSKGELEYKLGNLSYIVNGDVEEDYLYPGKNIVTETYEIVNQSNIETEIRIKFSFYLKDTYYDEAEFLSFIEENGFNLDLSNWIEDDGFYYYDGILNNNQKVTLFDVLIFDGKVIKNNYKMSDFKIKLTLHAKQKEHVEWEDLGSKFIN